ncbi:MAG: lactate dehydrogenase, partial [Thaumarchaeota archaeon]|nr:lactate dehydrogenase [Nitrososphaerota archaeon]
MITILGAGKVGSAIAFLCGSSGLDDVTLVNRNEKRAIGEALDITNSIPKNSTISVTGTSDYSQIKNSDVIVITASVKAHTSSRSDIMLEQSVMIRDIARKISELAPNSKV